RLLLMAISIVADDQRHDGKTDRKSKRWGTEFGRHMETLLHAGGFSGIIIKDNKGSTVFSKGHWRYTPATKASSVSKAVWPTRIEFFGKTWGLFWQAPETLIITSPLRLDRFTGSVVVSSELNLLYKEIRSSEAVILAYIGMNALILVLFGIYLLSRTVVRPINRLVAVTEKFSGDIPILQEDKSLNNEIGRLSQSLSRMLRQLDANEKKLKENISSLEEANQEIKRAQDEMVKSEKMASMGRLATGVAHEIGNPLGIILGYIELLQRGDLTGPERKDFLHRMESEITRIHRIIRGLLDFSRPSASAQQDANAHEILDEVITVITPQPLFEKIHISRLLDAKAVSVKVGADLLKQVFLNIIINAADAMSDKRACLEGEMAAVLTIESYNENGFLIMRFRDTGCGINRDDINRIFDPFFTTKAPGKGTGLGLSICYRILDQAGGRIRAESEPERGTTFSLEIPLADKKT
ncbi:MAG: HAMP domain-containing protein, partial [Deltaproteobacteria bacterium]|nr:HAMP domain-containing protein [Deltaproteobacteria bacterium]